MWISIFALVSSVFVLIYTIFSNRQQNRLNAKVLWKSNQRKPGIKRIYLDFKEQDDSYQAELFRNDYSTDEEAIGRLIILVLDILQSDGIETNEIRKEIFNQSNAEQNKDNAN
ncbi:hypothetical protein [Lentilactobacillus sp. SPB1-3]|uniref:Uncharacterized protein n=1 Tax=Lentilactobacillus terminaliae TaxID=3003483 RepID=A0ACD5DCZ4_9LACO|nr:hypothetical protein [Lentilactobacillus sp. SPB1-3]MCZ0978012.1 hypothetical protein [Lentilactobacillus sp. SPB1-3]